MPEITPAPDATLRNIAMVMRYFTTRMISITFRIIGTKFFSEDSYISL
jgi:hypothetical protein